MKKIILIASACALFLAQPLMAQETTELPTREDPAQGYLINSFKDNWFITAQGGVNVNLSTHDSGRDLKDRFAPSASLYVGKWFTPVWGARLGVDWMKLKGLGAEGATGYLPHEHMTNGYYKTSNMAVGPVFDVMANLTNLFCGYKPGRVYNFVFYVGAGGYWTLARDLDKNGWADGWYSADKVLTFRGGIINSFNVSKQVQLFLDLRATAYDGPNEAFVEVGGNRTNFDLTAFLGLTYLFNQRDWKAPVVPVPAPAQNCDAITARLAAADSRVNELENSLRECLNRPAVVKEVEADAPLATIYYPINVYRISREDGNVLNAIANVMKANPNTKYVLTGWADNYTGTPEYNETLRHNRVNGVYDRLIKLGVPAEQLEATINNGTLCKFGDVDDKYVSLDRAVTIEEAK